MKLKFVCAAGLAFLLTALFLPVFYCVIFIGNGMNYNEEHKIATLCSNEALFAYVIVAAGCVVALCILLRKIPYRRTNVWITVLGSAVFCVILYFLQVEMSKCIAFYGGWDCGMVANSARWVYGGEELGYGDYYTVYTNNVPITWLLYKLYGIADRHAGYPYNPEFLWIQFQCAMFSLAAFLASMTTLAATRKIGASILTLLVNSILLVLSPWKIIPYTDGSTIAIPILLFFLYVLYLKLPSKPAGYGLWFALVLVGLLGGIFKATCYIGLIAVLAVEVLRVFWESGPFPEKLRAYSERTLLFLFALILAVCCKKGIYKTLHYQYDRDTAVTWSNYLYNGLNEQTTGACSSDGLELIQAYEGDSRKVRDAVERQYIKDRIREKGKKGLADFWLRKQVMNFNDGTFSWFQEGFFHAWDYEELTQSRWKEPLREFYWLEGSRYLKFTTISQGIWIFVLLGIVTEAVLVFFGAVSAMWGGRSHQRDPKLLYLQMTEMAFFIGIFLFVMLFEGRARYLFNSVSSFAWIAVMGYYRLSELFRRKK